MFGSSLVRVLFALCYCLVRGVSCLVLAWFVLGSCLVRVWLLFGSCVVPGWFLLGYWCVLGLVLRGSCVGLVWSCLMLGWFVFEYGLVPVFVRVWFVVGSCLVHA